MASAFLFIILVFANLSMAATFFEKGAVTTQGWKQLDTAPNPIEPLFMSIALQHPGIHAVSGIITSGARLSMDQISSLRQPDPRETENILLWLASNEITDATVEKDWIHVRTTVTKGEELLKMKLHRYSFEDKQPVLRTTEYTVPDALLSAIDFIHPITNFMTPAHQIIAQTIPPSLPIRQRAIPTCSNVTTPDCITDRYRIGYKSPGSGSSVRFAIGGFLDQFANYADADEFLQRTKPAIAKSRYNFSIELAHGGRNLQDRAQAGSAANQDIQYAMAIGYPTQITYLSTGGRGVKLDDSGNSIPKELSDNEPYLELVEHLLDFNDDILPHVLSLSYSDDELSVSRPYAERVCSLFGMLAGRGVSIVVASGDGGMRGSRNSTCRTNNDGHNKETTMATFPGTCPWVTAVGAVTSSDNPPRGAFFSGGGFSQWFERPTWQEEAVGGYVKALRGRLQGYYNPNKRAIPDISALGTGFLTVINGKDNILHGTGGSATVFASMIALVNDARLRRGKRSLGWLNKKLYSPVVRKVLYDITDGVSKPCEFSGQDQTGWPAMEGWDAITGLGTPGDFNELLRVLVNVD